MGKRFYPKYLSIEELAWCVIQNVYGQVRAMALSTCALYFLMRFSCEEHLVSKQGINIMIMGSHL